MGYRIHPLAAAVAVAFSSSAIAQAVPAGSAPVLDDVVVSAGKLQPVPVSSTVSPGSIEQMRPATSDTASLLRNIPGVSLYGAGGVSSLPAIHGLADDRLRIKVDGMDLIASCPNHMNPALSYVDPTNVGTLKVYAGITPVSVGGDSIGGTIVAERPRRNSPRPARALTKGEVGAFYRSNGNALGRNLSATSPTESFSVDLHRRDRPGRQLQGRRQLQDDYGHRPHRPYAAARRSRLDRLRDPKPHAGFAFKSGNHLFEAKFGYPGHALPALSEPAHGHARQRAADASTCAISASSTGVMLEARAYHEKVDSLHGLRPRQALLVRPWRAAGRFRR